MSDIAKTSMFCRTMKNLAQAFRQSFTGRAVSWKFHDLEFPAKPLVKVQNFTQTSLAAKYLSESLFCRQMKIIFEEEKSRDD